MPKEVSGLCMLLQKQEPQWSHMHPAVQSHSSRLDSLSGFSCQKKYLESYPLREKCLNCRAKTGAAKALECPVAHAAQCVVTVLPIRMLFLSLGAQGVSYRATPEFLSGCWKDKRSRNNCTAHDAPRDSLPQTFSDAACFRCIRP